MLHIHQVIKGKFWVYSLVSSQNLSPDFTISPLIIGNGPILTHLSYRGSQLIRVHYKVTFPLSYQLLLGRQRNFEGLIFQRIAETQ